MKRIITFVLLLPFLIQSQSSSVFDAAYFDKDNTAPPLKIGKGFHINDVYRQTRGCFIPETCHQNKLTSQQTGGKKTTIKIYHTVTNEEYSSFRRRGASGKISFLNLFSIGGGKLEDYSNKQVKDEERIIFTANVDFGVYSFDLEPTLMDEAKQLVTDKKLDDFVKFFGTHYISGIKKESSIYVILTRTHSLDDKSTSDKTNFSLSGNNPTGWGGSVGTESSDKVNEILEHNEFSVEVEIYGPELEKNDIKGKISDILSKKPSKQADAISNIIEGAMQGISNPDHSIITQYYYTPFTLYGLDGIYWDEKKQIELTKLNQTIISVYASKSYISEMITESGKKQYLDLIKEQTTDESYIKKFLAAYDKAKPAFVSLNNKADAYLKTLETKYLKCSDIFCPQTTTCCNNDLFIQEIEKFGLSIKVEQEERKLTEAIITVAAEMNAPECEKKKMGIIRIENYSSNPYSLYQGDKFIQTIKGKEIIDFTVDMGQYQFKAVQESGYLMYATVNNRNAVVSQVCEEVVLKIGFED
jgi:hypothetical protein